MSNNDNNSEKDVIDKFDEFWEEHKHTLSSKLSICLGVLGGVGSALVGLGLFVPASVVLGVCNVGIFFAGISLSKFEDKNKKLKIDNISLQNEKNDIIRRFTINQNNLNNYNFPTSTTPQSTESSYDTPINFNRLYFNSITTQAGEPIKGSS